jgi:hypothetical protein
MEALSPVSQSPAPGVRGFGSRLVKTLGNARFRLLLVCLMALPAGYQFVVAGILLPLSSLDIMRDFGIYYRAARLVAAGKPIYDLSSATTAWENLATYIYSPALAVLLQPLARLPLDGAQSIWMSWSLACLVVAIIATGRAAGARTVEHWSWVGLAFVSSYPVVLNLQLGQLNTTLLALLSVWLWAYVHGRRSGWLLIGIAAAVKLYSAPLLLLPLLRRDLKALLLAGIGGLAVLLVGVQYLPQFVFGVLPRVGVVSAGINNTSLLGSVARVIHPQDIHAIRDAGWADVRIIAFLLAVAAIVACVFALSRLTDDADGRRLGAALMLAAGPLFASILWEQHLVMLLPAIVVAVPVLRRRRDRLGLTLLALAAVWLAVAYPLIAEGLAPGFHYAFWVLLLYADQGGLDALVVFLVLFRACFLLHEVVAVEPSRALPLVAR